MKFKKGDYILDYDIPRNVYKVIGIAKIGYTKVYILRPKGSKTDKHDLEETVRYIDEEYMLEKDYKKTFQYWFNKVKK